MRCVEAEAPTRIDLAGGTLDLPPLDLLVPGASTLNAAITLPATATVRTIDDGWELCSVDQKLERRFARLEDLRQDTDLPLLSGLLAHFSPDPGVRLETRSAAPAGAGLGGSSALAVAVAGALTAYEQAEFEAERVLAVARDVETRVLGVPAGVQDYVAALRGGVCSLRFGIGGMTVDALDADLEQLRRCSVLVYTGLPRSSGINNWQVTKAFLDGDAAVRDHLEGIARATEHARNALLAGDLEDLARAVDQEWSHRRRLAPGVSTDAIDGLLEAARGAGGLAGKVCGAGGGGCVFLLAADGRREDVEAVARGLGMEVLPFDYAARGLSVVS